MTRGNLIHPFPFAKDKVVKEIRYMSKKVSLQEFVERSRIIHQGKYSYELVTNEKYSNLLSIVPIICPIHGVFEQLADNHIRGHGCGLCAKEKPKYGRRRKVCGVGVLDVPYSYSTDKETQRAYSLWSGILQRCYGARKIKAYQGCSICKEWIFFSNFKKWFDDPDNGYQEGYHVDKDILVKGNKIYSPQTCCFVPQEINKILITNNQKITTGVSLSVRGKCIRYHAYVSVRGKRHNLGFYTNKKDAFLAYKRAKELYVQEMANLYYKEKKITKVVYEALMNYKVSMEV